MNEVINYVMETPGNTNPNVLRGMLQNSGSSDLPPVTSADNGKILVVDNGQWVKSQGHDRFTHNSAVQIFFSSSGGTIYSSGMRGYVSNYQMIPITYNDDVFSTNVTPSQVSQGDTNNMEMPPFTQSVITYALFNDMLFVLHPTIINMWRSQISFQTSIFPLDSLGMSGYVGFLSLDATDDNTYEITLFSWQVTSI